MITRSHRTPLIAGAVVLGLALVGASPAVASSDVDPGAVVDAVTAAAPINLDALGTEQVGGLFTSTFSDGGTADVGIDPRQGLSFTTESGTPGAVVSLPNATDLSDAILGDDGSVTFAGDAQVPSVNVLSAENAVRVSTVIASATQTEEFEYDFGPDATVELQQDGSALVLTESAQNEAQSAELEADVVTIIAVINAPWAIDASGASIDTHYVADGGVLTQVVKHQGTGAAYPVVADPTFDSPNAIQVRARFNRAETATIAAGGWGGVIGSFSCGAMAPVCVVASGTIAYQAGLAQNSKPKKCVQITATSPIIIPGLIWWVDTYSGGNCK